MGSQVQVSFHGRPIRGWVLGSTDEIPSRLLDVRKVVSPVRYFDDGMLALFRWVSERYVAPLAAVIARSHPPRVASEEMEILPGPIGRAGRPVLSSHPLVDHRNGAALSRSISEGSGGTFVVRPAPEDEVGIAVEAVADCLAGRRRAIVLVPEATPLPATATAIQEAFGDRVGLLLGGDRRTRYRRWLEILAGRFEVVVGTRPAVFAPLADLGLMLVSRESHPAHREDRAPYHHVRDVSLRRAQLRGAVCILSAVCPSAESTLLPAIVVSPTTRRWPPVEVVRPGPEGRAPRLVRALRETTRAFLLSPLHGYGLAQVCRVCGNPAACAACGGLLRSEGGVLRCVVCEAEGRCAACGAIDFGIRRGGAERVEEWAAATTAVPVKRIPPKGRPRLPDEGEVLVGGPEAVRDLGPGGLDLVAILDADLAERRPGLASRERALSTWMEAVGWARPSGRAIVQSEHSTDPAIQALVRGNPDRFHEDERRRRQAAGFPVGAAVFRIVGPPALEGALVAIRPITLLVSSVGDQTVCLLALEPDRVPELGRAVRELAARDLVIRVEAEPHL